MIAAFYLLINEHQSTLCHILGQVRPLVVGGAKEVVEQLPGVDIIG